MISLAFHNLSAIRFAHCILVGVCSLQMLVWLILDSGTKPKGVHLVSINLSDGKAAGEHFGDLKTDGRLGTQHWSDVHQALPQLPSPQQPPKSFESLLANAIEKISIVNVNNNNASMNDDAEEKYCHPLKNNGKKADVTDVAMLTATNFPQGVMCATVMVALNAEKNDGKDSCPKEDLKAITKVKLSSRRSEIIARKKRIPLVKQRSDPVLRTTSSVGSLLKELEMADIRCPAGVSSEALAKEIITRRNRVQSSLSNKRLTKKPKLDEINRNTKKVLQETYGITITPNMYAPSRHQPRRPTEDRHANRRHAVPTIIPRQQPEDLEKMVNLTIDSSRVWTHATNEMIKAVWHRDYERHAHQYCAKRNPPHVDQFFEELDPSTVLATQSHADQRGILTQ